MAIRIVPMLGESEDRDPGGTLEPALGGAASCPNL